MMRKLKNRRGVTIVEMLVAIVVLALLTCAGIVAAAAAMANFLHMNDAANADILASTVLETVAAEVRQGQNIALTEPDPADSTKYASLTLDSRLWGTGAKLQLNTATGRLVAVVDLTVDPDADPQGEPVLPDNAYAGLKLKDLTWTKVGETETNAEAGITGAGRNVYTVTFTVCNDSDNELWHDTVTVAPMRW